MEKDETPSERKKEKDVKWFTFGVLGPTMVDMLFSSKSSPFK